MLNERLQILVSAEQRRRLEHEAQRRQTSVARVIREAVEAQLGGVTRGDRIVAVEGIRALRGALAPAAEQVPEGRAAATLRPLSP